MVCIFRLRAHLSSVRHSMRYLLFIMVLALTGCSEPPSRITRLSKYADENHITYITEFPIYFQVEVVGTPDLQMSMEKLLLEHGFDKGLGAAYMRDGTLVGQQYLFGDTFDIGIASLAGNIRLTGYGIRTSDQNVEPTLRKLLQFIEANYKTNTKELRCYETGG